jgi:exonuclease VII large subunit
MSPSQWEREQERRRKAAERAEQQRQREFERAKKDAAKAAQQRHLELRDSETNRLNTELENRLQRLQNILETALKRKYRLDEIIANAINPVVIPPVPQTPPPSPPDKKYFESQVPRAGLLEKMTGIGRSNRLAQFDEIKRSYEQAVGAYKIEKAQYSAAVRASQQATAARQKAILKLREQVSAKEPKAVIKYFTTVLEQSEYRMCSEGKLGIVLRLMSR